MKKNTSKLEEEKESKELDKKEKVEKEEKLTKEEGEKTENEKKEPENLENSPKENKEKIAQEAKTTEEFKEKPKEEQFPKKSLLPANKAPEKEKMGDKEKSLDELWKEVEEARKKYVEADYKKSKIENRLKKVFGSFLKEKGEKYKIDDELEEHRASYDEALEKHKGAALADAKKRKVSKQELQEILKVYLIEKELTFQDTRVQVKLENQEGKFSGFIKDQAQELVEKYRKMPLAKKIAFGTVLGFVSAGAVYAGGTAAGLAGAAITAKRVFGGLVTGTSVSLGFEARSRKKAEKKIEKKMEEFGEKLSKVEEELNLKSEEGGISEGTIERERLQLLEGRITEEIKEVTSEERLKVIKNQNSRHLIYGIAAGIAGAVVAPKIFSYISEFIHAGHFPGHGGGLEPNEPKVSQPTVTPETPVSKVPVPENAPSQGGLTSEVEAGEGKIIFEVKEGDSLWKFIGEQLEEYEGFSELAAEQKTYVLDALKDQVAEAPEKFGLENPDILEVGQKIDLTELFEGSENNLAEFMEEAKNLSPEQLENIKEYNGEELEIEEEDGSEEKIQEKTSAPAAEETASPNKEAEIKTPETAATSEAPTAAEASATPETSTIPEAPAPASETLPAPETGPEETTPPKETPQVTPEPAKTETLSGSPAAEPANEAPAASEKPPTLEFEGEVEGAAEKLSQSGLGQYLSLEEQKSFLKRGEDFDFEKFAENFGRKVMREEEIWKVVSQSDSREVFNGNALEGKGFTEDQIRSVQKWLIEIQGNFQGYIEGPSGLDLTNADRYAPQKGMPLKKWFEEMLRLAAKKTDSLS